MSTLHSSQCQFFPRRMSVPQKVILASEIVFVFALVRLQMRRDDIRDVVASIRTRPAIRSVSAEAGAPDVWLTATRLARAVTRTLGALPTDTRCLSQSLVLLWMLSRRAIPSTLVIAAHGSEQFEAHAWIEHAGRPLLSPCGFSDDRLVEI